MEMKTKTVRRVKYETPPFYSTTFIVPIYVYINQTQIRRLNSVFMRTSPFVSLQAEMKNRELL